MIMMTYIILGLITAALFVLLTSKLGLMDEMESVFPNKWAFIVMWVVIWPFWVGMFIYNVIRPRK